MVVQYSSIELPRLYIRLNHPPCCVGDATLWDWRLSVQYLESGWFVFPHNDDEQVIKYHLKEINNRILDDVDIL